MNRLVRMEYVARLLNSESFVTLLSFSLIAAVFTLPIFENIGNWGIQDWDLFLFFHSVSASTILEYHQIPLWNPYHCGGTVLLAHPYSRFPAPSSLLTLFFGVVSGLKLQVWLHLVIGMFGVYKLTRYYGLDRLSGILPAFVFMLNSMYPLNIAAGMPVFMSIAYLPWAFLCYLKAFRDLRYAPLSALCMTFMYLEGGVYQFFITLLFLALYSYLSIPSQGKLKTAKVFLLTSVFIICLGAVKFLPSFEFLGNYPRLIFDYSGYSLSSLSASLLDREQSLAAVENYRDKTGLLEGMSYFMDENGMYVGVLPLLLFLLGLGLNYKYRWQLTVCLLIFLWLSFGNRIPLSIWELLHFFPPFVSMRVAQRFRIIFMLCFALFAGFGFQHVRKSVTQRVKNKTLAGLVVLTIPAIILFDILLVSIPIFKEAFVIPPLEVTRSPTFHQTSKLPLYGPEGIVYEHLDISWANSSYRDWVHRSWSSAYPAFLSNVGTVDCREALGVPRGAVPDDSEYYLGEVFVEGTGGAQLRYWSPNRLVFGVNVSQPGYLLVNQNYYPGWRIKGGDNRRISSMNGLLAAEVLQSDRQVELYYLPTTFILGLIISSATVLYVVAFIGWHRTGKNSETVE